MARVGFLFVARIQGSSVSAELLITMLEAASTIENLLPYIINSFIDKRFSDGFTEGTSNKIKILKRVGFGYKDFWFLRGRILYSFTGIFSGLSKND